MPTLYGLMDAARDERLFARIDRLADSLCLFSGPLEGGVRRAAPYVVNLENGPSLERFWEEEGRRQFWGIQCFVSGTLNEVRRHFRRFLEVKLPDDDLVMFRFYDPRVFVPYIRTCSTVELQAWFEAVHYFKIVDGAEGRPVHLSLDGTSLQETSEEPVRPTVVPRAGVRTTPLRIRPEQIEVLVETLRGGANVELASYAQRRFPEHFRTASTEELIRLAAQVRTMARQFGIEREDNVATFLDLTVMYGEEFHLASWAADVLGAQVLHGPDKVALLRHRVELSGVQL